MRVWKVFVRELCGYGTTLVLLHPMLCDPSWINRGQLMNQKTFVFIFVLEKDFFFLNDGKRVLQPQ